MTGTGTADDPFIVDNWEEYSSIGHEQVTYAEFAPNAENKVIDFNEICPEGFSETVHFARHTNFNDWTLKNFHSTATYAISSGSGGGFSNLIFENFYWCPHSTGSYFIRSGSSTSLTVANCIISGQIQATGRITRIVQAVFRESSLNVIANCDDSIGIASEILNSEIVLDISAKSVSLCFGNIINSRVSGRVQTAETFATGDTGSAYNVFNVQSNKAIGYSGKGISVYNSDTAPSLATEVETFKGCTAEQLRDAQYLYDLRFPIGVE